MKINLEPGTDIRNGYINISSWPTNQLANDLPDNTQIIAGQSGNLDPVVGDGMADEIVFNPLLNVARPNDILSLLEHWYKKLKDGGLLKVSYVDIRLAARFIYNGELKLQQVHELVFGPNKQHESVIETDLMKNVVKSLGFKIENISHDGFFVTLEAIK